MNASGPESISSAIKQAESASAYSPSSVNQGVENQLHGAADIASARNFFVPKVNITPLTGIEHSTVVAGKAAEGAISPMLQLVMRLPGHLGLFSSFLEAFKNLFFSHDLFSNLNLGDFASGLHGTDINSLTHGMHNLASNLNLHMIHPGGLLANISAPSLHISPAEAVKQSLNVSAGIDLQNPQYEASGLSVSQASATQQSFAQGDALAGPSISSHNIVPKLSPAERIFRNTLDQPIGNFSSTNQFLASNSTNSASNAISNSAGSTNNSVSSSNAQNVPGSSSNVKAGDLNLSANSPVANTDANNIIASASKASTQLSGLHAKALSLDSLLHKTAKFSSGHGLDMGHKYVASNPFSKISSGHETISHHVSSVSGQVNPSTYPVKSGDSLWKVAAEKLGAGKYWREIYALNQDKLGVNPGLIHKGMSLNLPKAGQIAEMPSHGIDKSTIVHKSFSSQYTVKPGDSLWKVSENVLGSGDKWPQLYKLNAGILGSKPNLIFAGQKLALGNTTSPAIPTHNSAFDQLAQKTGHPNNSVSHQIASKDVAENGAIGHHQNAIAHNHVAAAPASHSIPHQQIIAKHGNPAHTLKPQVAKEDHVLANKPVAHGLSVQASHDQLLSGAGGAQAADENAILNKAPNIGSVKDKSVVSFSLTPPDLVH